MNEKIIKNDTMLVISDYNWLPDNIEDSWIPKYTDNYLIYDKFHRDIWKDNPKVIKQKNIGQNIYDMFDFIITHYDNLPENSIFCRSCIFYPKGRQKPLTNGNCNEERFITLCNNNTFTELHDEGPDTVPKYHGYHGSKVDENDGTAFLEINNSWFSNHIPSKYFKNTDDFLRDVYKNPILTEYMRFSPGACYLIPKTNILKYPKKFYEEIIKLLTWDVVVCEAHILERCIYTFFTCDWELNDKYK